MGLDIVEFVMDVETAFGVELPNDELARIATPRQLMDFVHSRLPRADRVSCLSQQAFYTIRRVITTAYQAPAVRIRPRTPLAEALPGIDHRIIWSEVGRLIRYERWEKLRGQGLFTWLSGLYLPDTFGAGALELAVQAPALVKPAGEGWAWTEVRFVIDRLMREHFAIRSYRLDDRFVEDLGLD